MVKKSKDGGMFKHGDSSGEPINKIEEFAKRAQDIFDGVELGKQEAWNTFVEGTPNRLGWICPQCGLCLSPDIEVCECC
jgi:hypothetical protein